MSTEYLQSLESRRQRAVTELTDMIKGQYRAASFVIRPGIDDETAIHITATVDVEDPDGVMDLVIDRLVELQVEEADGIALEVSFGFVRSDRHRWPPALLHPRTLLLDVPLLECATKGGGSPRGTELSGKAKQLLSPDGCDLLDEPVNRPVRLVDNQTDLDDRSHHQRCEDPQKQELLN